MAKSLTRAQKKVKKPNSRIKAETAYMSPKEISTSVRKRHENAHLYEEKHLDFDPSSDFQYNKYFIDCDYTDAYYDALEEAISSLTKKQQMVVKGYLAGESQKSIGKKINITQGAISQLWKNKLGKGILRKLNIKIIEILKRKAKNEETTINSGSKVTSTFPTKRKE